MEISRHVRLQDDPHTWYIWPGIEQTTSENGKTVK